MFKSVEKKFRRDFEALNEVFDFVAEYFELCQIKQSNSFEINLAIEELFTNIVKYQSEGENDISIELKRENNDFTIIITDFDVNYFDITRSPDVDINRPLEERKDGGLGLFLVRKMMDKVEYEYKNRTSRITITKILEN